MMTRVSTDIEPDGATESVKSSGLYKSGISYEYGINEMFAIEGSLLYSSYETDTSPKVKASGLENPTVTLKGTSDMGSSRLRFGLEVGMGLEKAKIKSGGTEFTAATGGWSLMPYIGMDMDAAGGIIGGRLSYDYLMERTIEVEGSSDIKRKEGHELGLSAFYETAVTDVLLGGAINYVNHAALKDGDDNEVSESHSIWGVSLYSRVPFGTWALIPRLDYDFSATHYDKYNFINLSVAARFGF